jgi:hypothetical protein
MAIRGFGWRPDRPTSIGADVDRMADGRPKPRAARTASGAAPADGASPSARGRQTSKPPDPSRVGVVLVHGIGSQKPGETLLLWAHSLLRVVNAWAATTSGVAHGNDHALTADIDLDGHERPWVAIDVPAAPDAAEVPSHGRQTWLLTEAWWAARVSPPTLSEMYRWLVPSGEIRSLIRGIFHGVERQDRLLRAIDRVFLVPFVWLATLLAVVAYIALSAVRVIPYKPLQDAALFKALDTFLIDWFGDLRILVTDRTQAASIRSRAIDAIRACAAEGCATIVVIGHSGGTIVGYTTLTDTALEASLPVARLITLGQALGIGWRLGHALDASIADRLPEHLYEGDRLRAALEQARPGVEWHDFWATHDPAPAGGFANAPSVSRPSRTGGVSTMVFNRMSILEDHGGYWDNDEEFLLPVARLLETAPSASVASTSRFFPEAGPSRAEASMTDGPSGGGSPADPSPDDRSGRSPARAAARQARVAALQRSWLLVMIAGLLAIPTVAIGSIVWGTPTYQIAFEQLWSALVWLSTTPAGVIWSALGIGLPGDPPDGLLTSLLGIAIMAVAFWGVGEVASRLWEGWDARERHIALQPVPQWRRIRDIEVPIALCGLAAIALLLFAFTGSWLLAAPSAVLLVVASIAASLLPKGTVLDPSG